MRDLRTYSAEALLRLHYCVLDELKARKIIRNASAPIGEYAEVLFCDAFNWTRVDRNSHAGYDATDKNGNRIQIKARRLVGGGSRQVGSLRNLKINPFDKLAAVLFSKNLEISRAAIIPLSVVKEISVHDSYTNSFGFMLEDTVWNMPDVQDVTEQVLIAAAEHLEVSQHAIHGALLRLFCAEKIFRRPPFPEPLFSYHPFVCGHHRYHRQNQTTERSYPLYRSALLFVLNMRAQNRRRQPL
jgi:hypothetical protein